MMMADRCNLSLNPPCPKTAQRFLGYGGTLLIRKFMALFQFTLIFLGLILLEYGNGTDWMVLIEFNMNLAGFLLF